MEHPPYTSANIPITTRSKSRESMHGKPRTSPYTTPTFFKKGSLAHRPVGVWDGPIEIGHAGKDLFNTARK